MTDAAREYGTALYELCAGEGLADTVLPETQTLAAILEAEPAWGRLLACPTISYAERTAAARSVLEGRVHPYLLNFVCLLIEHRRMTEYAGCAACFRELYNEANGILEVKAFTAVPLTESQRARLCEKLAGVTGKKIHLEGRVDASLMGGVRLEMDGRCLDGSVRGRLTNLRRSLLHAHA